MYPLGQELSTAADRVIPGGVNSGTRHIGPPHAFSDSEGAWLTDVDGNRYLDYHAAFGAMLLGHKHPVTTEAAHRAIDGIGLTGAGVNRLEIQLAELIASVIPSAEKTLATTSGSEATAQAIRLSRAVTGRRQIIKFQGGFHGWHDPVARNVISTAERAYGLDPLSQGILPDALAATSIAEFNDLASVEKIFIEHSDDIAAVILEPIPHNVGALLPEPGFLRGLRELTQRHGTVLVLDEVITGFRHALGGYQAVVEVRPDLTTFGKAMANGFPIGGIAGSAELMDHFDHRGGSVLVAGTFNGHPISCAAAIATIEYLQANPDFYTRTYAYGERLRTGLGRIVDELNIQAHPAGFGGVFALYFTPRPPTGYRDLLANDAAAYLAFHRRMTERGFFMLPMALKRNHISGSHTETDIERTLDAAHDVLSELAADGTAPLR